jgi:hypothetical protein
MGTNMEGFTDELRDEQDVEENTELSERRRAITLGMDIESWLASTPGRLCQARATAEIREIQKSFESVDPSDAEAIRKLQFEIAVRRQWYEWLKMAVDEGRSQQSIAIEVGAI